MANDGKPPDGGWGWVIVGSVCVIRFLNTGYDNFGMFLPFIMAEFGCSKSEVSTVASVFFGLQNLGSPVTAALTNRFGVMKLAVIGNAFMATAMVLSSLVPNLTYLLIVLGIFGGIGLSLNFLPSLAIISYYFDKKIGKATAIGMFGNGAGSIVLPFVVHFLNDVYGWRGALLILGGVALNSVALLLLLCPPPSYENNRRPKQPQEETGNEDVFRSQHYLTKLCDEMYTEQEEPKKSCLRKFHCELLCHPQFVSFCTAGLISCIGLYIPTVYTVSWGTQLGFESELTTTYVALVGLGFLIGRTAFGFIADFVQRYLVHLYVALLLVQGALTAVLPFFANRVTLGSLVLQFTIFAGGTQGLINPILKEMLKTSKLPTALGLVFAAHGIGMVIGPPLMGLLPSYELIFATTGALSVFAALVLIVGKCIHRKHPTAL